MALAPTVNDDQWLIKSGYGKITNANHVTQYINALGQNNQFAIKGICFPDRLYSREATNNDIFVIYQDGSHFNCRIKPSPHGGPVPPLNFFYYPGAINLTEFDHNMESQAGTPIDYLYLTNTYENDDPPRGVAVYPGHLPNASNGATPYYFDRTQPSSIITLNRTIRNNHDVTMIIDVQALRRLTRSPGVILKYNQLVDQIGHTISQNKQALEIQTVFNNNTDYALPPGSVNVLNQGFELQLDLTMSNFIYINFRPLDDQLHASLQDFSSPYAIRFEIMDTQGQSLYTEQENLVQEV